MMGILSLDYLLSKQGILKIAQLELVLDTLGFIFISTGSIVAAVKSYGVPILVGASVCGLLASYLLVVSMILSFVAAHRPQPADPPV
ncbi:uncharacterized protein [Chanodichthys erythropterus]|uniref:uncharacterized protein isoform X2 n=1 Tax=Chanodichthys erythropterus TaxID=933992 RepID=UPI00351EC261